MTQPQFGDLDVLVVCGTGLKDLETFGRMDPYCILELAGQRFVTGTHTDGGKNPVFNERFKFINISPQYATELHVKVMDKNVMMADKEIGSARHALASTYSVNCHDLRLPLVTPKGKSAGELQMVLSFKPHIAAACAAAPVPPVPTPAAAAPCAPQRPSLYPTIYQGPHM